MILCRKLIIIVELLLSCSCEAARPVTAPEPTLLVQPENIDIPISKPAEANRSGEVQIRNRDRMKMVFVPAGQFEMGTSEAELDQTMQACVELHGQGNVCQREGYRSNQPVHPVTLDAFWVDQTEVSNAQFAAFLNEQGNQEEDGISWRVSASVRKGLTPSSYRMHWVGFRCVLPMQP